MKLFSVFFLIVFTYSHAVAEQHVFYYHGQIVEEQGANAKSKRFGEYQYRKILKALSQKGFTVHAGLRRKGTDIEAFARAEAKKLQELFKETPASSVTLIGASKGGRIVIAIQNILKNRELKSVLLASIFKGDVKNPERQLYGKVIYIYDKSDSWLADPYPLVKRSKELASFQRVVVDKNLAHGLIFKPYGDWVEPTAKFIKD